MSKGPKFRMNPELSPISSFNTYAPCVSAVRQVMMGGNLSQALEIFEPEVKKRQSGMEREFTKGAMNIQFPCDANVLGVVRRYGKLVHNFNLNKDPEDMIDCPNEIVIFEDDNTGEVDYLDIRSHNVMHQQYGFSFQKNEDVYPYIGKGQRFAKDTVIATSPSVNRDGQWMPGKHALIAQMTHPAGIEDGFLMSDRFARSMRGHAIEKRVGTIGNIGYPINRYGRRGEYKIFPDIGETIDHTGILFSVRPFSDELDAIYMTDKRLRNHIACLDRPIYAHPKGRVVDISVIHDPHSPIKRVPDEMTAQLMKYVNEDKMFHLRIIELALGRHGMYGWNNVKFSKRMNILLQRCIATCGDMLVEHGLWPANRINELRVPRRWRGEYLDEFRFEITFEYESNPIVGPKYTDLHGSKGVNTLVIPWQDMPTDKFGNVCDMVYIPQSCPNRMNNGRGHEELESAAGRTLIKRIRRMLDLDEKAVLRKSTVVEHVYNLDDKVVQEAFDTLMRFYKIVSPAEIYVEVNKMLDEGLDDTREELVIAAIMDGNDPHGLSNFMPLGTEIDFGEMVKELSTGEFKPEMSKLKFRDLTGKMVETEAEILIGSMYILSLEKTATDFSGVAISRTNHFGICGKLTQSDKYSSPGREVTNRHGGNSEFRNWAKATGGEVIAAISDLNNDLYTLKNVARRILEHETPTNIDEILPLEEYRGRHRARQMAHLHMLTSGKRIIRPHDDEEDN